MCIRVLVQNVILRSRRRQSIPGRKELVEGLVLKLNDNAAWTFDLAEQGGFDELSLSSSLKRAILGKL